MDLKKCSKNIGLDPSVSRMKVGAEPNRTRMLEHLTLHDGVSTKVEVDDTPQAHSDKLYLLKPLVQSEKYALAAAWQRQAECLKNSGNLEAAMSSYQQVVQLAPQHLEARITLASLLKHFGRVEDALTVLSQNAEMEILEPGLLYKKCIILSSDPNRAEEFLAASQLLFARHFAQFRNHQELSAFTLMRPMEKRKAALRVIRISRGEPQQDTDAPDFSDGKNLPSVEKEWQLFLNICIVAYNAEKYALLQHLAFSAMGSERFYCHSERGPYLEFLSLLSCLYNKDAHHGFNLARAHLIRHFTWPRMWNILNIVIQTADDKHHNVFLMRLIAQHPNNSTLMLLHANDCLVTGNYNSAFSQYSTAFRNYPTPLIAFLLGVTLIQMACQNCTARKRFLMSQALGFFWKYQEMRGEDGYQESHYNIGRAFHQLGFVSHAIYHYNEALNFSSPLISKYPHLLDLKREAAFNLHLIYMHIGVTDIARRYIEKYIVI